MSHYTRGIAQSITRGGTSLNIDSTDPGSLLIGNNSGSFDLNQLTAGTGVTITNGSGTITISATGSTYTLPIASVSILGGIKVGANLSIDGTGILSGAAPYTLPIASGSVLGGIKVGSGLSIDGSGVLSTAVISDATTTVSGIVEVDRNASANPHPIAYTREGLAQTPVIDVTRGLLSLGGSPFDGTSVGHFVGGSFGNDGSTLIAVNLPSSYSGNVLDFQLIGVNFLNLDTTPNLVLTGRFSGLFSNGINNLQGAVEPGRLSVAGSPTSLISDSNILGFAILTNSRQQASYWVARTNSESALTCNARPRQSDSAWVRSMSPNGASAVGLDEGTIKLRVFAAQAASTITWTDALTINSAGVVTLSSPLGTASGGTGVDSSTAANGQLLIGTGSGLALATLTAGTNITITNTSGHISIASTGGGGSSTLAGDTDVSIASPVGGQVLGYNSSTSKWANQNVAGVAATTTTSVVGSDVTMTSANTFYDGPSVSLPAGTWLLTGAVTVEMTSSGSDITAKLWDGTTVYASGEALCAGGTGAAQVDVAAVVSPTATTTYKISAAVQQTGGLIKASTNANASAKASYLTAIQLSGNPVGQQAPAVRCYNSSNSAITASTLTALTFNTNRFDQGTSTAQHSTSSNTSRLVCQQSGIYYIAGNIQWSGSPSTNETDLIIRLNGTTTIGQWQNVGTDQRRMAVSTLYQLNVGDYVELIVYTGASGLSVQSDGNDSPEFMMARIDSGPGAVQPNTKVQLDWAASTDIGVTALSATTWTDVFTAQSFTVDDVSSVVEIAACGLVLVGNGGTIQTCSARLNIDSGATTKIVSGCRAPSSDYANILSGSTPVEITGLSAGSHTVKLQIYGEAGTNYLCQASTHPNVQGLGLRVLERKQSVSPPSSTPAPAVRAYNSTNISIPNNSETVLTFDSNKYDQGTSTAQHSTSSNTSRLTCQQAGVYVIAGDVDFASSGSDSRYIYIRLNGTTRLATQSTSGQRDLTVITEYYLNVGDYVELLAFQNSGVSVNVNHDGDQSPVFSMARVDSGGQGFVPIPMVKTASYIILNTDSMIVAGANSLTFTLPACSSRAPGMPLVIKNDNFTGTTLSRAGSDTIDDATSYVLSAAYASVTLVGDGSSKWRII